MKNAYIVLTSTITFDRKIWNNYPRVLISKEVQFLHFPSSHCLTLLGCKLTQPPTWTYLNNDTILMQLMVKLLQETFLFIQHLDTCWQFILGGNYNQEDFNYKKHTLHQKFSNCLHKLEFVLVFQVPICHILMAYLFQHRILLEYYIPLPSYGTPKF